MKSNPTEQKQINTQRSTVGMTFTLYVDQLTLEFWKGKIDPTDCMILAFIADLNPQDPEITKYMYRGHFLVTRKWLLEKLPMLQISEQAVYKRLRKLKELGILSCLHKTVTGNKSLAYFKMSGLYYKIHRLRHEKASKEAKKVREVEYDQGEKAVVSEDYGKGKSHSLSVSKPWSPETIKPSINKAVTTDAAAGDVTSPPPPPVDKNQLEVQTKLSCLQFYNTCGKVARAQKIRTWLREHAPEQLAAYEQEDQYETSLSDQEREEAWAALGVLKEVV